MEYSTEKEILQAIFELEFMFGSVCHNAIKEFFKQCFEYFRITAVHPAWITVLFSDSQTMKLRAKTTDLIPFWMTVSLTILSSTAGADWMNNAA